MKQLIIIYLLFCIVSCNQKNETITLKFSPEDSNILDERFIIDKISFEYKDSIYFQRYYKDNLLINEFFKYNGQVYQYRPRKFLTWDYGVDSILTFSQKDTLFTYNALFPEVLFIHHYTLGDCKYIIKNKGDYITTTKQSTLDTTFREIFYYDKNFRIFKYVNTYQDNIAVYLPEK